MKKLKSNILVFSIFLVITAFLWLLLAFNEIYTTNISIPIKVTGLPDSYGNTNKTPKSVLIRITGTGKELYKLKNDIIDEIPISYKHLTKENNQHYILRKDLSEIIKSNLPVKLKLLKIYSDSLFLFLKKIISKKVPVQYNLITSFGSMCDQFGPVETKPDSIVISGSKSILDKVDFVSTKTISLNNISDTVRIIVALKTQANIRYSKKNISILIPVEKYTEKSVEVDIAINNLPDSLNFVSFPNSAEISFRVGLSNYNKILAADFKVYADYNKIMKHKRMQYCPEIEHEINYIKNIRISPSSFEYFLESKKGK